MDYNKLTVVQIRELFKTKNIPTTGLTRKQQLIDRLLEEDAKADSAQDAPQVEETVTPAAAEAAEDVPVPQVDHSADSIPSQPPAEPIVSPAPPATESGDAQEPDATSPPAQVLEPPAVVSADAQTQPQENIGANDYALNGNEAEPPVPVPSKEEANATNSDEPAGEQQSASASVSTTTSPPPEESRKRKRRSKTPSVSEEEVAQKKAKQEEDGASVVLKEDIVPHDDTKDEMDIQNNPNEPPIKATGAEKASTETPPMALQDDDQLTKHGGVAMGEPDIQPNLPVDKPTGSRPSSPIAPTKLPHGREKKYKELMSARIESSTALGLDGPAELDADKLEWDISPALHPASPALYIRDFMRPLRPDALEAHLTSLAHPPRKPQGEEVQDTREPVIRKFHLDAIRTHCFVVFDSVSAASRVRSAIHDRVWPPEGNRKPLWADFFPEDKVQGWIDTETDKGSGGRAAGGKRWEVAYERLSDGTVATTLQEATSAPVGPRRSTASGPGAGAGPAPPAPVPQVRRESSAVNGRAQPQPASFVALDSLFKSTTAKPKLYFLPVSKELADKRLDEIDALTTRHGLIPTGGAGYPDSRRYTFENDDKLVDNGPEFGLRQVRGPRPYRGR